MIALLPVLAVVRWAKILENSTDYSIQNTTRHALFLPTSREAKYKAKQAIDSFFCARRRHAAGGRRLRRHDARRSASAAMRSSTSCSSLVWLGLAVAIAREHRKLAPADAASKAA